MKKSMPSGVSTADLLRVLIYNKTRCPNDCNERLKPLFDVTLRAKGVPIWQCSKCGALFRSHTVLHIHRLSIRDCEDFEALAGRTLKLD